MDFYIDNTCVYYGLKYHLISKNEVFKYIKENPKSITSLIAYRQSCILDINDNELLFEIIDDKDSFQYKFIYILSGGKALNTLIDIDSINNLFNVETIIKSLTSSNSKDKFLSIAGMNDVVKNSYNFKDFVKTDRINDLKINNEKQLNIVLDRLDKIYDNYSYFLMLRPLYGDLIYRSDIEKLINTTNIEKIKKFFNKNDNIVSENIFNLNKFSINVFRKSKIVQLYLLGIEFFFNSNNDLVIDERLKLLNEDYEKLIEIIHKHPVYSSKTINEYDTLSENWKKYLPFDIFIYNHDEHIYAFTRPEFNWIIVNKKNPWNNKDIDESVIKYLEFLIMFASENKFPKSMIFPDIWEKMEEDKQDLKDIILKALGLPENILYHLVI